jgi:hypothetical protein
MDDDVLILKYGGRWDFWHLELPAITRFIDLHAQELVKVRVAGQAPVAMEQPVAAAAHTGTVTPRESKVLIWDPRFGGMRMPHLHYRGEIYALNPEQWTEFSKMAVTSLAGKLGKAEKITFETLMDVSKAVAGM